ncbi:MAG TPA: RNA pyrophosphohydrolase [Xanthobacteraceae bacterium]|nr:RNA pyrophosphohydrolase [Xanthobacteraceae bacterium]
MPNEHFKSREPSLEEMLADPIVWLVMKSDGIDQRHIRDLLARVAGDLAAGGAEKSSDDPATDPDDKYRRGVGIMLLNREHEVFVGRRLESEGGGWQMPQGGIDGDEEPREAAFRELKEEIGTDKAQIVAESKAWLRYNLPPELAKRWSGRWCGQQQKWFVMRFLGSDSDINVATEHPEFTVWKWVPIEHLPDLVVSFKRQLYVDLLRELQASGTIAHSGSPGPAG